MTSKQINQQAMQMLEKQNWFEAQRLFFENAKHNPSHETYNNLGYYLISEGLTYKNGKARNALKLGLKYLVKAAEIKTSFINTCAIIKAADYMLRYDEKNGKHLLKYACDCMQKVLQQEYSNVLQYNYLRFLYLNAPKSDILNQSRNLVRQFACDESVSLYLELLRVNGLLCEGLECVKKYGGFLNEIELIMFYSKFGLYEKGYKLCETIFKTYSVDEFIASAIIECCLHTNHLDEAQRYAKKIEGLYNDIKYDKKEEWCTSVIENICVSTCYRKSKIETYRFVPALIESCCYFGCSIHKTNWSN